MTGPLPDRWRSVCLCLIDPPGFAHGSAVTEVIEALAAGLHRLGAGTEVRTNDTSGNGGVTLVILPSLLDPAVAARLPPDAILYNFEQIGSANDTNAAFHAAARHHVLWDYSRRNLDRLRRDCGHERLVHVPVGYVPELTRIEPDPTPDIDVLFYGRLTPRRHAALRAMVQDGLTVRAVFGVYGAQRDALIARARLVVNIHHAADSTLEEVRLSYLMANGRPILTECGPQTDAEPDFLAGIAAVPYAELARTAADLVRDPAALAALGARGFDQFRQRELTRILRRAIDRTEAL